MTERPTCTCFDQYDPAPRTDVRFHSETQDIAADGWLHLLELIEQAAVDHRPEFAPIHDLSSIERRQIVTLPPTIAKLTAVRHFVLYGSHLVRIPPEIGAMRALEEFTPYTSHRLHWFPYEITRCQRLQASTVSTRSLYGNTKLRPPFPHLQPWQPTALHLASTPLPPEQWGAEIIHACSVCNRSIREGGLYQVWVSLRVGTDVLPLLVNACSKVCLGQLPTPPKGYIPYPHVGGVELIPPAVLDG